MLLLVAGLGGLLIPSWCCGLRTTTHPAHSLLYSPRFLIVEFGRSPIRLFSISPMGL